MREPLLASPLDLDSVPDRPAVFLLWAGEGKPYLARTALLRRRLIHLQLAQQHFPDEWQRIVRLRPPAFVRLTLDNQFPRTMVTTRLGRGLFYGPFPSRGAAENFNNEMLDLFQVRRCEENLQPSPQHPGCIYGEMNRCLRPCQQAVSIDEYKGEAARVEQFLRTSGASLKEPA